MIYLPRNSPDFSPHEAAIWTGAWNYRRSPCSSVILDSRSPLRCARNDGVGWPTLKPSPSSGSARGRSVKARMNSRRTLTKRAGKFLAGFRTHVAILRPRDLTRRMAVGSRGGLRNCPAIPCLRGRSHGTGVGYLRAVFRLLGAVRGVGGRMPRAWGDENVEFSALEIHMGFIPSQTSWKLANLIFNNQYSIVNG
jgi:hypothetical protein